MGRIQEAHWMLLMKGSQVWLHEYLFGVHVCTCSPNSETCTFCFHFPFESPGNLLLLNVWIASWCHYTRACVYIAIRATGKILWRWSLSLSQNCLPCGFFYLLYYGLCKHDTVGYCWPLCKECLCIDVNFKERGPFQ